MIINKTNFKDLIKQRTSIVDIKDWQCSVKIKQITISQQLEIEDLNKSDSNKNDELIYSMICYCCIDEQGNPVFNSKDEVKELPSAGLVELFEKCLELNGIGPNSLEQKSKN